MRKKTKTKRTAINEIYILKYQIIVSLFFFCNSIRTIHIFVSTLTTQNKNPQMRTFGKKVFDLLRKVGLFLANSKFIF